MKTIKKIIFMITFLISLQISGTTILIQTPESVIKSSPIIVEAIVKDIKFNFINSSVVGEDQKTQRVVDRTRYNKV